MAEPLRCDTPAQADHAQLYELLVSELTDYAVFLTDPTGCITSWNPGVERILGYTEAEWLGRPAHIIFTPEDRAAKKPEEEMAKAARDGRAPDIRWHQRKDGSRLFVDGTMVALKDGTGQLLGFSKVMRDITERKKAEEALRNSEERLTLALEAGRGVGTWDWDVPGDRLFYDAGLAQLLSIDPQRGALGEPLAAVLDRIHPDDHSHLAERVQQALQTGEYSAEYRVLQADGSVRWVDGRGRCERDAAGNPTRFPGLIFDITARKKAEEALRASEARQAFLLRLSDALRPLRDPEAIKAAACRVVAERLGANRAFYAEIEGDDWVVEGGYTQGVTPLLPGRYGAGTYGRRIMDAYRAGERVVFRDTRTDPGFATEERAAHVAIDILGAVGVPLVKEERLVAILAIHTAEPRDWTEEDIALVEETAERTWSAVERTRAETALRTSEARYRTLFESIDEGFCIIQMLFDGNGKAYDYRYLEANSVFEQQSGLVDFMGRTIREFAPDLEEYWFEGFGQVALTGEPMRFENHAAALSRWFNVYAFRVGAPEERKVAVLFKDTTAQKAAAAERERLSQQIEAERERLQQVFSQAPVGVCVLRGRGLVYELANTSYQALLPGRPLIGRRLSEVIPELDPEIINILHRVLDIGEPFTANERLIPLDKDGDGVAEDGWYNVVYHPLRELDGTVSSILNVVIEVTAQVLARHELERVNRGLEEFAHVASHDLQEPLRMVNSYSQLLVRRLGTEATEEQQEFAGFIQRGVKRMEKLIKDLLAYSRTVHTVGETATSEVSLDDALRQALIAVDTRVAETGATITHDPLPIVRGDMVQLTHVFQNLLSNALKYQKPTESPCIHISAQKQESEWLVSVRDNGIGFDPHQAERIFGLFKRLHTEAEYPGTGLGLAICQRIIERYGGKMWAESEPGVGSTFFFSLPGVPS